MNDVTVVYDNGIRAVNKASLRVDEGEFVFLVGASGSGKTTIIKLLTAEVRPTEGKVLVNNYNIGEMKKSRIPYLRRTIPVCNGKKDSFFNSTTLSASICPAST